MPGRKTFTSREEMQFYIELGAMMHAHRTRLGLSQADVARVLGVTFQQIQKYESATNRVPVFVLHKMARAYGVSFASIIGADMAESAYRVLDGDKLNSIIGNIRTDLDNLTRLMQIKK